MSTKNRQSNMELLRIFSMLCIVVYHIFLFGLDAHHPEEPLYKSLQIPFHVGVPIFVMISGYFGIRFSLRGLFRLLGMAYIYAIVIELLSVVFFSVPLGSAIKSMLVIGTGRHWFLTTYLWLYLLSPIFNRYFTDLDSRRRLYLGFILFFMVFYCGHLMKGDPSLESGKNIINFLFLYYIGNTIHYYESHLARIKWQILLLIYILFNSFVIWVGYEYQSTWQLPMIGNIWYRCFEYDSVGLYLNSILVFLLFSRLHFSSGIVNNIASSVFTMYLISVSFIWDTVRDISVWMSDTLDSPYFVIVASLILAIAFMIFSVIVDKLFSPLWRVLTNAGELIDKRYGISARLR